MSAPPSRKRWPPHPGPALYSFALYFTLCSLIGEMYPFSRYEMYAHTRYLRGALLVVEADGQPADIHEFDGFLGIAPEALHYPSGEGYGQEYLLDVLRHHVATHQVTPEEATRRGPGVRVRLGYRVVHASDEGPRPEDELRVFAEGTAWRSD